MSKPHLVRRLGFVSATAIVVSNSCPSGVTGGSRPSGGSTINEVPKLVANADWLRSSPNWVKSQWTSGMVPGSVWELSLSAAPLSRAASPQAYRTPW